MTSFSNAVSIIGQDKIFIMEPSLIVDKLYKLNYNYIKIIDVLEDLYYFEELNSYCEDREPNNIWLQKIREQINIIDEKNFNEDIYEEEILCDDYLKMNDIKYDNREKNNIWYNEDDISSNKELVEYIGK